MAQKHNQLMRKRLCSLCWIDVLLYLQKQHTCHFQGLSELTLTLCDLTVAFNIWGLTLFKQNIQLCCNRFACPGTVLCSSYIKINLLTMPGLSFFTAQHDLTWVFSIFPACICVWAAELIDKGFDSCTDDKRRTDASQKQGVIRLADNLSWHSWTCSQNWILPNLPQFLDFHLSGIVQTTWSFFF